MHPSTDYTRGYHYGAQLWTVTRELDTLDTDRVQVAKALMADEMPPVPVVSRALTQVLLETPIMRRAKPSRGLVFL